MKRLERQFEKLGFEKMHETRWGAKYVRVSQDGSFRHILGFTQEKPNGGYLLMSFQDTINASGRHNMVELTEKEAALAVRKMRQMRRKNRWRKKKS